MIPLYYKIKILDGGWKSIDMYIYTLMEKVKKKKGTTNQTTFLNHNERVDEVIAIHFLS